MTELGFRNNPFLCVKKNDLRGQKPRTKYDSNLVDTKSLKHSDNDIIFAQ
jgi:hypothetical protein